MEITILVNEDSGRSLDRVPGMGDPNLTESAWQKAKGDAWGVIKSPIFEIGAAIVGLLFASAALIASEGQPATTQAAASVFFGVLSFAVTLSCVFLTQLVAAPVRQRDQLRSSWSEPIKTVNIELTLRDAYRKGNDIAKELEAQHGYTRRDRQSAKDWADGVVSLMAGNVPDQATRDFMAAGGGESSFVRQLRQQVTALQKIVHELSEG